MIFSNPLLDFAIGLTAFFLTASVTVSTLQETVAQALSRRAKDLRERIGDLLEGIVNGTEADRFFNHPLIAALNTRNADLGPSYIPRDVFTTVVKDLYLVGQAGAAVIETARGLSPEGLPIERSLRALALQTADELAAFDKAIGNWFDGTMDRLSGLYKRHVRWTLFWLGLLVAIAGNLDTLKVSVFLANNPEARESTANAIRERVTAFSAEKDPDEAARKTFQAEVDGLLKKSEVPMGWAKSELASLVSSEAWKGLRSNLQDQEKRMNMIGAVILSVIGWVLTALAVTIGATFWYDALKRFVDIRAAGPVRKPAG